MWCENHARRHRQLLDTQWEQTDWSRAQAQQILGRMDGGVGPVAPGAKAGARTDHRSAPGPNADKILSLYEPEVRVIVRGKAGAEVEFGNTVLLGENRQGMILDYQIFRESAPADSQVLFGSLLRVREGIGVDVGERW